MTAKINLDDLFEQRLEFPDPIAQERLGRLVGLDQHIDTLSKIISLQVNPSGLESWLRKHHPKANLLLSSILRRPALVVLAGDIGTGKSELAVTIGDAVARQEKIQIILFPLSLSSRGQGRVGEMTQLLSAAFDYTISEASKFKSDSEGSSGGVILLVDEADALAQSRETDQMHHEDRAGVNAFIRGIDRVHHSQLPAAVIMCTNRLGALDPAVKRRAAEILVFERPTDSQRREVLSGALASLGLTEAHVNSIVAETGPNNGRPYGFTYSDLTQRLLPRIILDAYPHGPVDASRAIQIASEIVPTPPFKENGI